jgi:hypothetical protein
MAVNAWKNLSSKSIDQDSEAKNFSKDLLLPFAGYSTYDAYYYNKNDLVWSKGRYANYWSSSSIERNA